jgi:hypothetical protein
MWMRRSRPREASLLILLSGWCVVAGFRSLSGANPVSRFRDVAISSSFRYVTHNDRRARKYFIQPMCGGVAILDYDADGKPDLYFTNGAELPSGQKTPAFQHCLLHGDGTGRFEDRTAAAGLRGEQAGYSFGVAAGDYDNDGYPDLFLANAGKNILLHNKRDGSFEDVTAASGIDTKPKDTLSIGAAWFDYDNDGLLDLVVSNYTLWTAATDVRCIDPAVGERYCGPTRYRSVPNSLYHNLGGGKFEDVTVTSGFAKSAGKGMGISIADFNADGYQDVLIVNDSERNFLFINQGDGTFREQGFVYGVAFNDDGVAVNGMGSDARDFNNDGSPDIFYNDLATQVFGLFLGEVGRPFRYASAVSGMARVSYLFSGWSGGFIDYDNDGWKDIYSANGDVDYLGDNASQSDTLFRNIEGKTLRDVSREMGPAFTRKGFHRGSAFGDLNNDGAEDIVVTGLNERPRILMNSAEPGAHWLLLDLVGTVSNRDAIGARVKLVTASGRTLYNHVAVSVGLMSSSDKRVHFGLGPERQVRSIEIRWPNGQVQTLEAAAADRILRIEEPRPLH